MRAKRSAERGERPRRISKLPAGLCCGGGIQRETAVRHARQSSLRPSHPAAEVAPVKNARSAGEVWPLRFPKIPIGELRAGAPAPAVIHDGMHFRSKCGAAHVQVRQRRARPKKSFAASSNFRCAHPA